MIIADRENIHEVDFEEGVVLPIDKPSGMTSFDVVKHIRRTVDCRKVGHSGTLDPMATGLLILCSGKATKTISSFMELEKTYVGTITLGIDTDTNDMEGNILKRSPVPALMVEELELILSRFIGQIDQIPPMYSAIKVEGRRLYKMARQGKMIPRNPRPVTVHTIDILDWAHPSLQIQVRCSKGTYIRALARDIGTLLKCGGTLSTLRRTRIGHYRVEDAFQLKEIEQRIRCYENI